MQISSSYILNMYIVVAWPFLRRGPTVYMILYLAHRNNQDRSAKHELPGQEQNEFQES